MEDLMQPRTKTFGLVRGKKITYGQRFNKRE